MYMNRTHLFTLRVWMNLYRLHQAHNLLQVKHEELATGAEQKILQLQEALDLEVQVGTDFCTLFDCDMHSRIFVCMSDPIARFVIAPRWSGSHWLPSCA